MLSEKGRSGRAQIRSAQEEHHPFPAKKGGRRSLIGVRPHMGSRTIPIANIPAARRSTVIYPHHPGWPNLLPLHEFRWPISSG
jgi:hypothetical protein